MAELSDAVINKKYEVISTTEFRESLGNITPQALAYAIKKDLVDFVRISPTVRIIVLTEKTKSYKPNASKLRKSVLRV